jgi:hypothetical protein
MAWILWVVLCFQDLGNPSQAPPNSLRGLDAVRQQAIEREAMRQSIVGPDKVAKATARRTAQTLTEMEFVNRFNRLMHAMVEFARAYDEHHTVDVKRLQLVKESLRDLEKNDELFRDKRTK